MAPRDGGDPRQRVPQSQVLSLRAWQLRTG